MEYDASLLREFAIEAREHLESVEDNLLKLAIQKDDPDREMIDKVFRSVHSIKGGAGFLSLQQMSRLAHAMEALLSELRSGERAIGNDTIDALIAGVDLIQLMLEDIDRSNDVNITEVHKRLSDLLSCKQSEVTDFRITEPFNQFSVLNQEEFGIDPETLREIPPSHEFLYLLRYDFHALWKSEKRSPVKLIKELMSLGKIADARIAVQSDECKMRKDLLSDPPLVCTFLYSTILDPGIISFASGLQEDQILKVDKESVQSVKCKVQNEPAEIVIDLDDKPRPAPEISAQYLSESEEVLERLESCIFDLSKKPENVREAFRMIHSFKSNSGLMGFEDFELLSHQIEIILDSIRSGKILYNNSVKQQLLQGIDALREGLSVLSRTGVAKIPDCNRIIEILRRSDNPAGSGVPEKTEYFHKETSRKLSESKRLALKHDIRVDLEKLDMLINLVGELVIAESMVSRNHLADGSESAIHNLRRIISELQDVALSMRMIPLSRTFRKMFRLVHDLSLKSGKQINLSLIGEDTEVDKTVIEHITDPLVHIIRNCADHGIEFPEERRKKGKPETGQIIIRAGHEAGEVVIQVTDDGQGLNREKILAKAVKMGIISGDGSQLSDEAVNRLIFEPGFSTASEVTDVSGRGVGMDVVRRNLEKLKGRIDIHTVPDKGTTLTFRLPLTLAIIEGMLIRVGESRYTVPLLSIRESFRPKPEQITRTPDMDEIIRIRDDFLPVLRLHKQYGIVPEQTELHKGILIRVASGKKSICLFADEIIGHHHTVIRGIPEYIAPSVKGISGFTILDNGEVSIILDVGGIIDAYERQENNEG